jgi:hypothetical protein
MTMNKSQIDAIMADLLALDSGLDEPSLRRLVEEFVSARPGVEVSPEFRQKLYERLQLEIAKSHGTQKQSFINFNYMNNKLKFGLAAVSAAAVLLLVINVLPQEKSLLLSGEPEIVRIQSNGFGDLTSLNAGGQGGRNQSGGGGAESSVVNPAPTSGVSEDAKLAAGGMGGGTDMSYRPINYKYTYKGEAFTVDSDTMEVFRRSGGFSPGNLNSFLSRFDAGLFNINKFGNASLDYVTASEQRDFGYTLSLDLKQGMVNISENWEKWQTPDRRCQDEACYQQHRITADQIPSDEAVINTANAFLDEYGIDRSAYGTPVVQNMWRVMYETAADKSSVYLPDTVSIVYPSKIGDNEVYDQGGQKSGMYVSVNVRVNKVSYLGELSAQRYEGSAYGTEKDTARLLKVAEAGGQYGYMPLYTEPNVETVELELGKPTTGYVRMWQNLNGVGRELYVPSLIFPVLNAPAEYYVKNVTVPLIKEILDANPNGGVTPMPMTDSLR